MTPPSRCLIHIAGLLLAAGSGQRFGGPKALADTGDGPWVLRALATLDMLDSQFVVVGASAEQVTALLPAHARAVVNPRHASGMGSSLIAGLRALGADVDAVVVMLVDLPDVPAAAVQRVLRAALGAPGMGQGGAKVEPSAQVRTVTRAAAAMPVISRVRSALVRATYGGSPGHPVLIGADHVAGVCAAATGDRGARGYLSAHDVTLVECSDLATGADVDRNPRT